MTTKFNIPFVSLFKVLTDTNEIIFYKNNRTKSFELIGNKNIQIELEDPSVARITIANTSHYSYKITV